MMLNPILIKETHFMILEKMKKQFNVTMKPLNSNQMMLNTMVIKESHLEISEKMKKQFNVSMKPLN